MRDRKQNAAMAGCILSPVAIATEVYSFTVVPKKEIGAVYKMLERFLSNPNIETL
jgi:hypothetical protein